MEWGKSMVMIARRYLGLGLLAIASVCWLPSLSVQGEAVKGRINPEATQPVLLSQVTAEEFFERAGKKYQLGDFKGAIADFNQAIKLQPDHASAYYNRGYAKGGLGDNQGALSDFQTAAKLYQQQGNTKWYQKARDHIQYLQK